MSTECLTSSTTYPHTRYGFTFISVTTGTSPSIVNVITCSVAIVFPTSSDILLTTNFQSPAFKVSAGFTVNVISYSSSTETTFPATLTPLDSFPSLSFI